MKLQASPSEQTDIIDHRHGYLSLPFDHEQFSDFMVGLLGKPQKISRDMSGAFVINLKDIQNVYHLLEQRISQQNQGSLIQFQAQIFFSDNSNIILNDLEALETYNEIRSVVSTRVQLTWIYLIKFSAKEVPEKQSILINISTSEFYRETTPIYSHHKRKRGITVEIEYTERTWAEDVASMLSRYFMSILKKEPKSRLFLQKYHGYLALSVGLIFFGICLVGSLISMNQYTRRQLERARNIRNSDILVEEKVDLLLDYVLSGINIKQFFYIIIYLIVGAISSFFIAIYISEKYPIYSPDSYLILTSKSREKFIEDTKKTENAVRNFILSGIIGILTGIIANYIFILLTP